MGDILDYLVDPNVIIRVLMRENRESLRQRKRFEDGCNAQSDMMKKPQAKECGWLLKARKEMDSALEPPERNSTAEILTLAQL